MESSMSMELWKVKKKNLIKAPMLALPISNRGFVDYTDKDCIVFLCKMEGW